MRAFGRLHIPDARDAGYLLRSAPQPIRLTRYWNDTQLWFDQGATSICVAAAWCHAMEDGPQTWDGDLLPPPVLYREAQQFDDWPGENYDGTSVRGGAKALQVRGVLTEYRWCFTVEQVVEAVIFHGPVVIGSNWYEGMFEPVDDVIRLSGPIAGGHAYVCNGVNLRRGLIRIKNSWGRDWAGDGRAWMELETLDRLLTEDGEACLGVFAEVPNGQ